MHQKRTIYSVLLALCLCATVSEARVHTLAVAVSTDTTSVAVPAPSVETRTIWGEVVCTAAVTCAQVQEIYGDLDGDAANGVLLCTITLSATSRAQDVCAGITGQYPFYYVVTSGTAGTGARGNIYVLY